MNVIDNNLPQITGVAVVVILLTVGRRAILPAVKTNAFLLWLAFAVTALCGLVLGWALFDLMAWLTSRPGAIGGVAGSVGALVSLVAGWHAVYLLIALIRDLADETPDGDARKAALLVPTFLPAGWSAVWGVVSNPRGLGTGLVAALMAAITIGYAHVIVTAILKGKAGRKGRLWFASGVCLLAGLVTTPLVLYLDGVAADHLDTKWLVSMRVLAGSLGLALAVAAAKDITDKIPDKYVRTFLRFGLPLVITFGALAVAAISGYASNGGDILTGGA